MLKPVKTKLKPPPGGSFAIVASQYNARYVDAMVAAAKAELKRAGVNKIQIIRVPGAFEIPVVAARLARTASHDSSRILAAPKRLVASQRSEDGSVGGTNY